MKGLENEIYLYGLLASNAVAILLLIMAVIRPVIARFGFVVLFTWACWMNWTTSQHTPEAYLEYADLTWSDAYRSFINGWFAQHIRFTVALIATSQGLIAVSLLLKGRIFGIGAIGAMLFLLAILPLGVGAGFPSAAIMAIALMVLLKTHAGCYAWQKKNMGLDELQVKQKIPA